MRINLYFREEGDGGKERQDTTVRHPATGRIYIHE